MSRSFSRLQRLEEKRNLNKAVWLILGTIVLITLTVTIGFNLLTKLFIFMGNLNSTNKPVEKTDFIPPSPPVFFNLFNATNSAVISLKGTAEPGSGVYLTQNSNQSGNVITFDDGIFEFRKIQLSEGTNNFSAVALDSAGNKSQISDQLTIYYSSKAPALTITTPADKQIISGKDPNLQIQGSTDADVRLIINERVVIVGSDGKFSYKIVLNQGENQITITAVNDTGNKTQNVLTVTYNP